jgi:hypothetical protein
MTERPILFSGPMVRAIIDGTKTQTRRLVKGTALWWLSGENSFTPKFVANPENHLCPHGHAGDRLWVRETYQPDPPDDGTWHGTAWRGCKGSPVSEIPERFQTPGHCLYRASWEGPSLVGWRPSIHMPRWASRIQLELTRVLAERLQDISEADAIAEGVDRFLGCQQDDDTAAFNRIGPVDNDSFPIARYAALWESINGAGSWDANPWVWCLEFKRASEAANAGVR